MSASPRPNGIFEAPPTAIFGINDGGLTPFFGVTVFNEGMKSSAFDVVFVPASPKSSKIWLPVLAPRLPPCSPSSSKICPPLDAPLLPSKDSPDNASSAIFDIREKSSAGPKLLTLLNCPPTLVILERSSVGTCLSVPFGVSNVVVSFDACLNRPDCVKKVSPKSSTSCTPCLPPRKISIPVSGSSIPRCICNNVLVLLSVCPPKMSATLPVVLPASRSACFVRIVSALSFETPRSFA